MKKFFIVLLSVLLLLFSCEIKNKVCLLKVNVIEAPFQSDIKKYVFNGTYGETLIRKESTVPTFTVSLTESGLWNAYVEAYGIDGDLIAKSDSKDIEILSYKDNDVAFQLKEENGTFNFKLGIPNDVTTMDRILCTLSSEEEKSNEVKFEFNFKADGTIDATYRMFTKALNLPAGTYNLKVETTNVLGNVYGSTINESVVIQKKQTTEYKHIWNMSYFPVENANVNNGGEYFPGYLYISKSSKDARVYCSFDNGEFFDITDKIENNYVKLSEFRCNNLRIVITSDSSKWTRGDSYFEMKSIGPAGGTVFYDCDADNDYGNPDALESTNCNWRYLEAAPGNLPERYEFGFFYTDSSSFKEITRTGLGYGKENTDKLIEQMGTAAKTSLSSDECTELYASRMARLYSNNGYSDWFLPSNYELSMMNEVRNHIGNLPTDYCYWSSSEYDYQKAYCQDFNSDIFDKHLRSTLCYVRPIRAFND